jgi:hypothetical protein
MTTDEIFKHLSTYVILIPKRVSNFVSKQKLETRRNKILYFSE